MCQTLAFSILLIYNSNATWVWRSLVARLNGVQEVGGSSPFTHTNKKTIQFGLSFLFIRSRSKRGLNGWASQTHANVKQFCLRQKVDTHLLPHWRDSEAEQVPSPIPTKNLYPCDIGFFVYLQSLKMGLERVGIARLREADLISSEATG